jgi:hypothetical protein
MLGMASGGGVSGVSILHFQMYFSVEKYEHVGFKFGFHKNHVHYAV